MERLRYWVFFLLAFLSLPSSLALVKNTPCRHTVHKFAFLTSKSLGLLLRPSIRLYRPEHRLMPDTWPWEAVPGQAGFKSSPRYLNAAVRSQHAAEQTRIVVTIGTTCWVMEQRCNFPENVRTVGNGNVFFHLRLPVSGLPDFVFLVKLRQIRCVGLMELGTDRPALFQLQWLWKNWIWTLLTSPPRVRFQLPWPVAKDYFILTHVKSELTYGAKPQPAEPSVSECKLISLAVCHCLENSATYGMEQSPTNETFQASMHVKYCMLLPPSLQPVHVFLFIRKWN